MAIKHVVLLNWKDGVTAEQTADIPSRFAAMRSELGDLLVEYQFGADAGLGKGNASFGIVATFKSPDDFAAYMKHPAHLKVVGELSQTILGSLSTMQFVID